MSDTCRGGVGVVALVLSGCGECVGELAVAPYPRTQLPHGGDEGHVGVVEVCNCLLYTSPSPRDS